MRQIAADAGVNLGLIHQYIGNKGDLMRAVLAYEIARGVGTIERALDGTLRDIFQLSTADQRYIRIIAWLLLRDPTRVEYQDHYPGVSALRAIAGTPNDDREGRDTQLMAAMAAAFGWIMFGPQLRAAFGTPEADCPELDRRISDIIASIVDPA